MAGIQGLGGIPEPRPEGPARARERDRDNAGSPAANGAESAAASDGVQISPEARAAAEVGRLTQIARSQDDVRAERVEQARQNLINGNFRDPEVVAQVAERILRFLG